MTQSGPREYTMIISDNGAGFPGDIDFKKTSSLGLLVNNLVLQLEGDISLDCTAGSTFTMHLRAIEDSSRK